MVQCQQCKKSFARVATLKRHVETMHAEVQIQEKCQECNQLFSRRDHLIRHQEYAHGNGRVACSNCCRTFRQDYLKQHESSCKRKRRLPGENVVINTGIPNRRAREPKEDNTAILRECFQASLEPNQILQGFDDSHYSLYATLPASVVNSNALGSIKSKSDRPPTLGQVDISVYDELKADEWKQIISSLRQKQPFHNGIGCIRIDVWPSKPDDYPPLPQSFVAIFDEMKQYCPDLDVAALMVPFYFNSNVAKQFPPWNFAPPPEGVQLFMLPCIRCNDCDDIHIVLKLASMYQDFSHKHATKHEHRKTLRRRLVPKSRTIGELAYTIYRDDDRKAKNGIERLAIEGFSANGLTKTYERWFSDSIFAAAHRNNETDLLAYFIDENCTPLLKTEGDVLDWARASKDLDIVRMVVYRRGDSFLWTRRLWNQTYGHLTIIDKLVHERQISEAVALIEFAASHNRGSALVLACECRQDAVVASMLQAGADPVQKDRDGQCALEAALAFAGVDAARMLLEAGANVGAIRNSVLKDLVAAPELGPSWDKFRLYRDAAEKVDLLKQHGVWVNEQRSGQKR